MRRVTDQQRVDALVLNHLSLVDKIAAQVLRRTQNKSLHRQTSFSELRSAGYIGLIQAAKAFDRGNGAYFGSFAAIRIHGAILDDIRSSSALSRCHWQQVKDGTETFFERSLTDAVSDVIGDPAPSAEHLAIEASTAARVQRAIATLPSWRMRRVLQRYERDETQKDLAVVFGVNESRVSQIEQMALRMIRQLLDVHPVAERSGQAFQVPDKGTLKRAWNCDETRRRRARAVKNGKRGAAVTRMLRRPKGGFGAQRTA